MPTATPRLRARKKAGLKILSRAPGYKAKLPSGSRAESKQRASSTAATPAVLPKAPSVKAPKTKARKIAHATRATLFEPAHYVEPMKALSIGEIAGENWLLEIKYDGYRALGIRRGELAELWSRNEKPLTESYPEVAEALSKLRCKDAVIDGEIVALDREGRPTFQLLQGRDTGEERPPIYYYVFDLLHLEGRSYLQEPIEVRKAALEKILKGAPDTIRRSLVFDQSPDVLLEAVRQKGLEGIIGKQRGSLYEPGRRSGAWVKKRISVDQEFVIGGYTPPRGGRTHFGALLVGFYDGDTLMYAGKVGTGFNGKLLASLHQRFKKLESTENPFGNLPTKRPRFGLGMTASAMREVTWLRPEMVAQIRFSEWTRDAMLRQPVFLGLREDKRAREVVREDTSTAGG